MLDYTPSRRDQGHLTHFYILRPRPLDDAVASSPKIKRKLKEMQPEGVLNISINVDVWQPQRNERKAELIKY